MKSFIAFVPASLDGPAARGVEVGRCPVVRDCDEAAPPRLGPAGRGRRQIDGAGDEKSGVSGAKEEDGGGGREEGRTRTLFPP